MKAGRKGLRTKTILVVGGYGYGNAGDEAQCAETLRLLAERYPDFQVRNLTPDPDFSFAEHPGFAHDYAPRVLLYNHGGRFDWYKLTSACRRIAFLFVSCLVYANSWFVKRGLPTLFINARRAAFLHQLAQARLLYFCGGGYLTGATTSRLWEGILLCRLAKCFGVPVAMSGQTIGVWNGPLERKFAHWGFKDVGVIGLRDDEDSLKALAEIGISGDHVLLTHDDALFCEKSADRQVEGRYIAVNFHYWGVGEKARKEILGKIHDAIARARAATGAEKAVFLAMHKSDMKSFGDYQSAYQDEALHALSAVGKFREIRRAIADAELLVTMKHHPIIFACGEGTPVVALCWSAYYLHKNRGAMGQYGVEKCCVDFAAEDWGERYGTALAKAMDRRWFDAATQAHRKILEARKNEFMSRVDALLGPERGNRSGSEVLEGGD